MKKKNLPVVSFSNFSLVFSFTMFSNSKEQVSFWIFFVSNLVNFLLHILDVTLQLHHIPKGALLDWDLVTVHSLTCSSNQFDLCLLHGAFFCWKQPSDECIVVLKEWTYTITPPILISACHLEHQNGDDSQSHDGMAGSSCSFDQRLQINNGWNHHTITNQLVKSCCEDLNSAFVIATLVS